MQTELAVVTTDPELSDVDQKGEDPDASDEDAAVMDPSKLRKSWKRGNVASGCFESLEKNYPWLYWYIAPVTVEMSLSAYATLFHLLNFCISTGIWSYIVAAFSATLSLIVVCVGIPLTWIAVEILILLARCHVATCGPLDYLQQRGDDSRTLSVFNAKSAPYLTSVFCPSQDGKRMDRIKYVFLCWHTYVMIAFYLVINPVVAAVMASSDIVVATVGSFAVSPILYAIGGKKWFSTENMCWGAYQENGDKCKGFAWDNAGKITLACFLGLVLLPLALRLCIFCANIAKESIYYFVCDDNYAHAPSRQDTRKLLESENAGLAVNGDKNENVETDDVLLSSAV
jgi:hypothetical protein